MQGSAWAGLWGQNAQVILLGRQGRRDGVRRTLPADRGLRGEEEGRHASYDYDLAHHWGGSGGLMAAKVGRFFWQGGCAD